MQAKNDPLCFKCPVCDAAPQAPCTRINGTTMPTPHTKRTRVALAAAGQPREDFGHAAARIVREATDH